MTQDRRNDLGSKVFIGVVAVILSLLIHHLVTVAYDGTKIGHDNKNEIVQLKTQFASIDSDLKEIKLLLRRGVPN